MGTLCKILNELSGLDENIIWTVDAFYSSTQVDAFYSSTQVDAFYSRTQVGAFYSRTQVGAFYSSTQVLNKQSNIIYK